MELIQQLKPYQNLSEALLDDYGYVNAVDAFGGVTNSPHVVVNIPADATNGVGYINVSTNPKNTQWNMETYDINVDNKREHTTITFSPLPQPTYDVYDTSPNETRPLPDYIEASPYTAGMPSLMSHAVNKAYQEAKRINPLPSTLAPTYDQQDGTQMLYLTGARRDPQVQKARHPYKNVVNETGI